MFEQAEIMASLGSGETNQLVDTFRRFAFLPDARVNELATLALAEEWGRERFVLLKYLAVHIRWSIEQCRFTTSQNQFYVTAGHLQTRYGTPIFLVFEPNRIPDRQPYCLIYAGSDISAGSIPTPSEIPTPPQLPTGAEIVMLHDHILDKNRDRVPFLDQTPRIAQMCALAGAIQWSLNRSLQLPYWYYGRMQLLVPLYLQSRENITQAPDLIAPVQVDKDRLLVRTVLLPSMPYANARVAVKRHDQLPHWLLSAWNKESIKASPAQIEDPEAQDSECSQ